jgi:hypothetical protein
MFVFDVSHTEARNGARPLPPEVTQPFEVRRGKIGAELPSSIGNAVRDGVRVSEREAGAGSAGCIRDAKKGRSLPYLAKLRPYPVYIDVPVRYEILLNGDHSPSAQYATLVHELAHLYCGHLGTPNARWWPDRLGLQPEVREFEAESVCSLVCSRAGIDNPSEEYLAHFVEANTETPPISLECVMKAAGLIERMGQERLPPRKEDKQ